MAKAETAKEVGEPRVYELGFLLLPTIAEEDVAAKVAVLKEYCEKAGGIFISENFPKKTGLAYPIAKKIEDKNTSFTSAYFGALKYEFVPEHVAALHTQLQNEASVLRFLLIQTVREEIIPMRRPLFIAKPEAPKSSEKSEKTVLPKLERPAMSEEELDREIEQLVLE